MIKFKYDIFIIFNNEKDIYNTLVVYAGILLL